MASPESNGVSEAFVKTIKRDYVHVSALPNAEEGLKQIVAWFEDYNENHPQSALRMRSPRATTETGSGEAGVACGSSPPHAEPVRPSQHTRTHIFQAFIAPPSPAAHARRIERT